MQSARQTMLARDGDSLILRMLVPVPLCGCIIGKDAAVLRSIMDGSQAQIAVSSQVEPCSIRGVPPLLYTARLGMLTAWSQQPCMPQRRMLTPAQSGQI